MATATPTCGGLKREDNVAKDHILILYDNRTDRSDLQPGWGFSALIELKGCSVLFDTGADKLVLEHNAAALGIDLASTDALVLSHEHCDHIGAITSALHKNLEVFYPTSFSTLFQGEVSGEEGWHAHPVSQPVEILPRFRSTGELGTTIVEQSLIAEGEKGSVLITGCAHPGIVEIARSATKIVGKPLRLVLGGFHLYGKVAAEVEEIAAALKELGVERVAPCHCTGEQGMKLLERTFGKRYLAIKVGSEVGI